MPARTTPDSSERHARAKADTRGFAEWRRNVVVSLFPALFQFYWSYDPNQPNTAVSELVQSVVVFGLVFILFPAIEYVWNWFRAPRRIAEQKVAELAAQLERLEQELSEFTSRRLDVRLDREMSLDGHEVYGYVSVRNRGRSMADGVSLRVAFVEPIGPTSQIENISAAVDIFRGLPMAVKSDMQIPRRQTVDVFDEQTVTFRGVSAQDNAVLIWHAVGQPMQTPTMPNAVWNERPGVALPRGLYRISLLAQGRNTARTQLTLIAGHDGLGFDVREHRGE